MKAWTLPVMPSVMKVHFRSWLYLTLPQRLSIAPLQTCWPSGTSPVTGWPPVASHAALHLNFHQALTAFLFRVLSAPKGPSSWMCSETKHSYESQHESQDQLLIFPVLMCIHFCWPRSIPVCWHLQARASHLQVMDVSMQANCCMSLPWHICKPSTRPVQ